MQTKHYYTMALSRVKNVGPVSAKALIAHCGSAEAVFKEKPANLQKIGGIGSHITHALSDRSVFKKTEAELKFIEKNMIKTVVYSEPNYPEPLKHCCDAPLLLFYKGQLDGLQIRPISIVGTRQMTAYGREFLNDFYIDLARYRPTIVSGLAFGVDVHAHNLALEYNLDTYAVLGHGFGHLYPKTHHTIAQKIIKSGALLTEYWSSIPPLKENFVMRNRIVAGLSQATLIIESAIRGGSLITADFANSYHRDVFALPGKVGALFSAGCNQLIKTNKAALLTSAKDLGYLLNWETHKSSQNKSTQKSLFSTLPADEAGVYHYLIKEGKQTLDIIALHCQFPIHKTTGILLNLELKVLVRPLPGKYYEAI